MSLLPQNAVVVADRAAAGKILCSPRKRAEFGYLVSIGAPEEREPAGFRNIARRIRLVFEDAMTAAEGGPSRGEIDKLIDFSRSVDFSKGRLLVHCQAGISRSSAAAMIVLAALFGPGREGEAVDFVFRSHPQAKPNRRMLELADGLLAAEGRLLAAGAGVTI